MTPAEAVEASRAAQGLPRHIVDDEALAAAVDILVPTLLRLRIETGRAAAEQVSSIATVWASRPRRKFSND